MIQISNMKYINKQIKLKQTSKQTILHLLIEKDCLFYDPCFLKILESYQRSRHLNFNRSSEVIDFFSLKITVEQNVH